MWAPKQKPPLGSTINWDHPLAMGLVGCWLFNEGSGNVTSDYAKTNNGIITGIASQSLTSGWVPGPQGYGLQLDGVNDKVTTQFLPNPTGFSVVFWCTPIPANGTVVGVSNQGANQRLYINSNVGGWNIGIQGSTGSGVGVPALVPTNQNTHVCLTMNGSSAILYINGVYLLAKAYTTYTCAGTLTVNTGDIPWGGLITSLFAYNRPLTYSEVILSYHSPYCVFYQPSVPAWMVPAPSGVVIPKFMHDYRQLRS